MQNAEIVAFYNLPVSPLANRQRLLDSKTSNITNLSPKKFELKKVTKKNNRFYVNKS